MINGSDALSKKIKVNSINFELAELTMNGLTFRCCEGGPLGLYRSKCYDEK